MSQDLLTKAAKSDIFFPEGVVLKRRIALNTGVNMI
jgi:hypothetical protein